MKVKLIKNRIVSTDGADVMNCDLSGYLKVGMNFYVFAIEIEQMTTYYYIYDNFNLFPVPAQMFGIIEDDLPSQWKIKRKDESLYICPELFNQSFFSDRFSDHDKELRDKFKVLAAEMYPKFEYEEW